MSQFEINIKDAFSKDSCVYIIKNKNNNKIYIGSTINFRKRSLEHKRDLEKNKHINKHLQKSYNKGNKFTIEILQLCQKEQLILLETDYVLDCKSNNKNIGYNILIPGEMPKFKITEKHKEKMITARRKKGYDLSCLRTREVIEKCRIKKYKKINVFKKDGSLLFTAKSMIDAEEKTGIKRQNISENCRNKSSYLYKNLYFRYLGDNNYREKYIKVIYDNEVFGFDKVAEVLKFFNIKSDTNLYKFAKNKNFEGKSFEYFNKKHSKSNYKQKNTDKNEQSK